MLYRIISSAYIDELGGEYTGYGLSGNGVICENITCDEDLAYRIVELLNEFNVEPCHVLDIITDILCDLELKAVDTAKM